MTPAARLRGLLRDERGATMVEFAFAFPVLIVLIYCIAQLGLVYRAVSGMQHALGEGARLATLCVSITANSCDSPSDEDLEERMEEAVYGVGPGTFTYKVTPIDDPLTPTIDESDAGDQKADRASNIAFVAAAEQRKGVNANAEEGGRRKRHERGGGKRRQCEQQGRCHQQKRPEIGDPVEPLLLGGKGEAGDVER